MLAPRDAAPLAFLADVRTVPQPQVNLLIGAGICLVAAQLLGIYALMTRKADLIFAIVMIGLLLAALFMGYQYAYHRVH